MKGRLRFGDVIRGMFQKRSGQRAGLNYSGHFVVTCRGKNGQVKWTERFPNLMVDVGIEYALDSGIAGGTWYMGLTATAPSPAAGDTMASHAGWTEFTNYDEAARQAWTEVRTAKVITNSASPSVFTISADSSVIGGAFITTDSTKSGSSGTLLCCGAFSGGDKNADDDDTLTVTYSITGADA